MIKIDEIEDEEIPAVLAQLAARLQMAALLQEGADKRRRKGPLSGYLG